MSRNFPASGALIIPTPYGNARRTAWYPPPVVHRDRWHNPPSYGGWESPAPGGGWGDPAPTDNGNDLYKKYYDKSFPVYHIGGQFITPANRFNPFFQYYDTLPVQTHHRPPQDDHYHRPFPPRNHWGFGGGDGDGGGWDN
jgi:hypothetical protein